MMGAGTVVSGPSSGGGTLEWIVYLFVGAYHPLIGYPDPVRQHSSLNGV